MGIASRLDFEPLIVGALPRLDRIGQVVHNEVTFCRRNDKDKMPDPSGSLGHRQSQSTRWEAALQEFESLRDRVVVAVSPVGRDRPTYLPNHYRKPSISRQSTR